MSSTALNVVLLGATTACWVGVAVLHPDPTVPNLDAMPQMVHTSRYGAFAPNENFADGATLRPPVEGTLARGALPLHYAATREDAARAGEELNNPVSFADPAVLARGARVFGAFCLPCHGAEARGDGPVVARGFPAPPSLLAGHAVQLKDGQLFHVVTHGQGNMPAYAAQLSPEDRWRVVAYLRSRQGLPVARGDAR